MVNGVSVCLNIASDLYQPCGRFYQ